MNSVIENDKKATEWLHKNNLRKAHSCLTCGNKRTTYANDLGDIDYCLKLVTDLDIPSYAGEIGCIEDSVCDQWEG